MEKMKAVHLTKNFAPNFAGETCGFPESLANKLVERGHAVPVDKQGSPVFPAEGKPAKQSAKPPVDKPQQKNESDEGGEKNHEFEPFVLDGLDTRLIAALAKAGIHDPEELRAYASGDDGDLSKITGVRKSDAELLTEMYLASE